MRACSRTVSSGFRWTGGSASGVRAAEVDGLHRDPADRLIVATALHTGARLLTADRRILDWPGDLDGQDARA